MEVADAKIMEIEEMLRCDLGFFDDGPLLPRLDDDREDDVLEVPPGYSALLGGEPISQQEVKSQAEYSGVMSGQVHFRYEDDEEPKPLVRQNSDPFPRLNEVGSLKSDVTVLLRKLETMTQMYLRQRYHKNKARESSEGLEAQMMSMHDVDSPPVLTPLELVTEELVKKYGSLKNAARVKAGCLELQKVIETTTPSHVQSIANQLLPSMVILANDFFGNYVVQCLIKATYDVGVVKDLCESLSGELGTLSKTQTGTRVVQALLTKCTTGEQWAAVARGLSVCIADLAVDGVGTYVMQKAVEIMPAEYMRHLYVGLYGHIKRLSEDRNGACGIRTCVKHCRGPERARIIEELAMCGAGLAVHAYGNYVVQAALEGTADALVVSLTPHAVELAKNKHGSNVVELLLKKPSELHRRAVMSLVMAHSQVLAANAFGNFVVQTAVHVATPQEFTALYNTLQPACPHLSQFKQGRTLLQLLRTRVATTKFP